MNEGPDNGDQWSAASRPRLRIHEVLEARAGRTPGAEALVTPDHRMRYGELLDSVRSLAAELSARGVRAGHRIAVLPTGTADGVALLYAISAMGCISVPLNPYWVERELESVLLRSGAACVITCASPAAGIVVAAAGRLPEGSRPAVATVSGCRLASWSRTPLELGFEQPKDTALLLFTSGSTGAPKGALLPHAGLVGAAHYEALALGTTSADRNMVLLPLYHVGGIVEGILSTHISGGTCILVAMFDAKTILTLLKEERVTITAAFTELFEKLKAVPGYSRASHRSLTKACIAGTPRAFDQLRALGIEHLVPSYGLTECCGPVTIARPGQPDEERRETVGSPLPGVELRIVDSKTGDDRAPGQQGEIRVRGWSCMSGYLDDDSGFDAEGFVRTGDLGVLTSTGALTYAGRLKRMIKTAGENVSEFEVETFMTEEIAGVEQVAVLGLPDEEWGEVIVAFLQMEEGANSDPGFLRERCKAGLAGFKVPKRYFVLDRARWPTTAAGKTDKAKLAEIAPRLRG